MKFESEEENVRLDQFLSSKMEISRSKVAKLIDAGAVTVDGNIVNASKKCRPGTIVHVSEMPEEEEWIVPEEIPLDIVYEDEYLIVINKASGMVVHPGAGNFHGTLVNALLFYFGKQKTKDVRPGIVHRIDKDTSGLLVVAKTSEAMDALSEMIREKQIKRIYLALVDGKIMHETGTIDAPIGRDPSDRQKMAVVAEHGKEAITHFKVLKRYSQNTLVEARLETGRTHQIRVHMAYIGHPVTNDPLYEKKGSKTDFGQFLHSYQMEFVHPFTKKKMSFQAELPKEFTNYLEKLEESS